VPPEKAFKRRRDRSLPPSGVTIRHFLITEAPSLVTLNLKLFQLDVHSSKFLWLVWGLHFRE
jgi:hypothetical protein